MSRPLPFSPHDGREDNRESNKTKSPPSPGTMAGPGQDKGRPDTSGHKRPSVKKNWEGCFMALRMDILVKTRPQPPTVTVSSLRKNVREFRNGSRFLPVSQSEIWRIITRSWGESLFMEFPADERKPSLVMCLFSEIDRVLCFMRKRTLGQDIGGVTGERESSETL